MLIIHLSELIIRQYFVGLPQCLKLVASEKAKQEKQKTKSVQFNDN